MSIAHKRRRLALIVEHNTWLRLTLTNAFEEIGFAVATASNGFGGLQKAICLQPDLVVIGSALPEVSSSQLAHELGAPRDRSGLGKHVILTSELLGTLPQSQWERKDPPEPLVERIAVAVQ
jgi:CheY-like chemotaxis protein